jgi:hypothetical protein
MCAAAERRCAAPPRAGPFRPCRAFQRSGLRDGLDEATRSRPLLRFLMLVTAGSAEGSWFPLRSPVKGKSNAGWRRSAACLVRFPHRPVPVATPGASEWVSCVSSPATNRSGRTLKKGAGNLANWPAAFQISLTLRKSTAGAEAWILFRRKSWILVRTLVKGDRCVCIMQRECQSRRVLTFRCCTKHQ